MPALLVSGVEVCALGKGKGQVLQGQRLLSRKSLVPNPIALLLASISRLANTVIALYSWEQELHRSVKSGLAAYFL